MNAAYLYTTVHILTSINMGYQLTEKYLKHLLSHAGKSDFFRSNVPDELELNVIGWVCAFSHYP